jgi:hypothetical protein
MTVLDDKGTEGQGRALKICLVGKFSEGARMRGGLLTKRLRDLGTEKLRD